MILSLIKRSVFWEHRGRRLLLLWAWRKSGKLHGGGGIWIGLWRLGRILVDMLTDLGCLSNPPLFTMLTALPWFQPQPLLLVLAPWLLNTYSSLHGLSHPASSLQPSFTQLSEQVFAHGCQWPCCILLGMMRSRGSVSHHYSPTPHNAAITNCSHLPKCLCSLWLWGIAHPFP